MIFIFVLYVRLIKITLISIKHVAEKKNIKISFLKFTLSGILFQTINAIWSELITFSIFDKLLKISNNC